MASHHKTKVFDDGRVCTRCREYKTRDGFYVNNANPTGHFPQCKKCTMKEIRMPYLYKCNMEAKQFMKKKWGVKQKIICNEE